MTVRRARPDEAEVVRTIVHAAYHHYVDRIGKPPGPMLDDYDRRIALGQTWVLEDAGALVGVLVVEDVETALLLDNIAVSPSAQGRGHGRRLIAFAELEARRRGYAELRFYTHALMTENLALYCRLGFCETGQAMEKGYDRVYMAKALA